MERCDDEKSSLFSFNFSLFDLVVFFFKVYFFYSKFTREITKIQRYSFELANAVPGDSFQK